MPLAEKGARGKRTARPVPASAHSDLGTRLALRNFGMPTIRGDRALRDEARGAHPVRGKGRAHPNLFFRRLRTFFQPD